MKQLKLRKTSGRMMGSKESVSPNGGSAQRSGSSTKRALITKCDRTCRYRGGGGQDRHEGAVAAQVRRLLVAFAVVVDLAVER